jgi:hypothetical protein
VDVVVQRTALQIHIQDIPKLNLDPEVDYPDRRFLKVSTNPSQ